MEGEEADKALMDRICRSMVDPGRGESAMKETAEWIGVPFWDLWTWINDKSHKYRLTMYEEAQRALAEMMSFESLRIVDERDEEADQKRVRSQTRLKIMEHWWPEKYGDRKNDTTEHNSLVVMVNRIAAMETVAELQAPAVPLPHLRETG